MATKTRSKKSRSKARRPKKKDYTLWYVGAGILGLIAIPLGITLFNIFTAPGQGFRSQGNAHVELGAETPAYNSNPPTSGWHTDGLASWGSYDYEVPEQNLVHNLEDGGVILYYKLGTEEQNEAEIERLEAVVKAAEAKNNTRYRHIVIAPREDLETTYALTAWTRLLTLEALDEDAMGKFIDRYEGIDHHVPGIG